MIGLYQSMRTPSSTACRKLLEFLPNGAQFIVGLREMHLIALFLYDTADAHARQETLDLARVLIDEAAAEGHGEYRAHNALLDPDHGHLQLGRRRAAQLP
jgi:hypothetical protein